MFHTEAVYEKFMKQDTTTLRLVEWQIFFHYLKLYLYTFNSA